MPKKSRVSPGLRLDRWIAISKFDGRRWLCRCDCGTEKPVFTSHLTLGKSKGCHSCRSGVNYTSHSMRYSSTYQTWQNMKSRCGNPNNDDYAAYGGAGIAVCERWMRFKEFLDDMGERPEGMTLDRRDGSLGYFKENCRWATPKQQANNIRTNRLFEYQGQSYTVAMLADHLNLNYHTVYARIMKGQKIDGPLKYSQSRAGKKTSA